MNLRVSVLAICSCVSISLMSIGSVYGQSATLSTTGGGFLQLVEGGWTYRVDNIQGATNRTGTGGGLANYVRGTTPDHLFQQWWWYRGSFTDGSGSDTREFALSNLDAANSSAGTAPYVFGKLRYNEPVAGVGNALQFDMEYIFDGINNAATGFQNLGVAIVGVKWMVTNTSDRQIEVNLFNYVDLDIIGPSGTGGSNDMARLDYFNTAVGLPPGDYGGWIKAWDGPGTATPPDAAPGEEGFNYVASRANLVGYMVGTFGTTRPLMTNTLVDNLPNTVATYPADFAAAYQWRMTLNPGESAMGFMKTAVNVPEPASMIALGAGLASLMGLRRRTSK